MPCMYTFGGQVRFSESVSADADRLLCHFNLEKRMSIVAKLLGLLAIITSVDLTGN